MIILRILTLLYSQSMFRLCSSHIMNLSILQPSDLQAISKRSRQPKRSVKRTRTKQKADALQREWEDCARLFNRAPYPELGPTVEEITDYLRAVATSHIKRHNKAPRYKTIRQRAWTLMEVFKSKCASFISTQAFTRKIAAEAEHVRADLDLSTDKIDRKLHGPNETRLMVKHHLSKSTYAAKDYQAQMALASLLGLYHGIRPIALTCPDQDQFYRDADHEMRRAEKPNEFGQFESSDGDSDSSDEEMSEVPDSEADPETESDEEEFAVEAILNSRLTSSGKEYLVKWQNYDMASNTWEPAANLNCPKKIRQFERRPSAPALKEKPTEEWPTLRWRDVVFCS